MVNYMEKFIPNLSDISGPLRELTHKDAAWSWYPHHQRAFDALKVQLASTPTLSYFDLELPVTLTCDTSQYGLGAACLQATTDGDFKPVSCVSSTLTDTEQCYSQTEKELLAVVIA